MSSGADDLKKGGKEDDDTEGDTYSLWLIPSSDRKYCDAIKKYDSIGFRPHVTLCPSFRCADRSQSSKIATSISKRLKGFKIELEGLEIDHSDAFFKSVFIRIKSTDSLMRATASRAEILRCRRDIRKDEAFDPHISVRTETGQKRRKRIALEIRNFITKA